MKATYSCIGAMAGSSMDGLDLAHVIFDHIDGSWYYQTKKCNTIPYDEELYNELRISTKLRFEEQKALDLSFGNWIGEKINDFKADISQIDLLGIHGHTVSHEPQNKVSWQLGDGQTIASITDVTTITDFRILDIINGGQGAPLVPYGDFRLFQKYDACLNLGGIANISIKKSQTAWDICPCNQVLNFFSNQLGFAFDDAGGLSRQGRMDKKFYELISSNAYFSAPPPKSLPNNFISPSVLNSVEPMHGLYTYIQLMVDLIAISLPQGNESKMLVTGGGAKNTFLIEQLAKRLNGWEVVVPDEKIVDFKESIVFAFLALKRLRNEINVLSSVTGASKDTSSGVIHLP